MICDIAGVQFLVYTIAILGFLMGQYFGIKNELSAADILACDMLSISRHFHYKNNHVKSYFVNVWYRFLQNMGRYFTKSSVLVIPVIPIFGKYLQFENQRYQYYQYFMNWPCTSIMRSKIMIQ